MFNLFPVLLLVVGLGGLVYIVSDHLSELSENDQIDSPGFSLKTKLASWANQLPLDAVKSQSLSLSQKLLHRMRIVLLKADNYLMKLIGKISEKDQAATSDVDFWKEFSKSENKIEQKEFIAPEKKFLTPEPEVKIDLTLKSNPETEKFFDIKPAKKTTKIRVRKSSK